MIMTNHCVSECLPTNAILIWTIALFQNEQDDQENLVDSLFDKLPRAPGADCLFMSSHDGFAKVGSDKKSSGKEDSSPGSDIFNFNSEDFY